jgi:hypothetical protein
MTPYDHATRDIHILFTTLRGDGSFVLIWTHDSPLVRVRSIDPGFLYIMHLHAFVFLEGFGSDSSARQLYSSLF